MANARTSASLGSNYRRLFAASTISNLGDGIGLVAYPWLASAVTRDPVLVALVVVAQRLPWLLFSLPAGVITDRYERRRLMVIANTGRAVMTGLVAIAVLGLGDSLPSPADLDGGDLALATNVSGYATIVAATLVLGIFEVLYDNTAQTILPSLVADDQLERANGRLWSTEQVMNTVAGPALGAALLAIVFALPFGVDALTFAASAWLISRIAVDAPSPAGGGADPTEAAGWSDDIAAGLRWLWRHELLRPLAITLGLLNGLATVSFATFVLFAQEVLDTSPLEFALVSTGGALGGVVSGWVASSVSARLGAGPSLWATLVVGGAATAVTGLVSQWPLVWLLFAVNMFFAVLWNVITVSLRQSIIPDHLLGRVNSVYRFFAWGMIPVGALAGGLLIALAESFGSREFALRLPWVVSGLGQIALIVFAGPRLTTARIEAARAVADTAEADLR